MKKNIYTKGKSNYFIMVLSLCLALCFVLNYDFCAVKALYNETTKEKNNLQSNISEYYDCEFNYIGLENSSSDSLPFETKLEALDTNASIIFSSKDEILQSLLSSNVFEIDAIITSDNKTYAANDFYDFSKYSKYEIVEWVYNLGVISEAEAIECMCDLFISNNYNNIYCLNSVFDKIRTYAQTHRIDNKLTQKISRVIGIESNDTLTTRTYSMPNGTENLTQQYSNSDFIIHYSPALNQANIHDYTQQEVIDIGDYLSYVKQRFVQMNFKLPILQTGESKLHVFLTPTIRTGVAASTYGVNFVGNVCASYFIFYGSPTLDIDLKQVIAHEYFHAIQNSYNRDYGNYTKWFAEAVSNWAAAIITGSSSHAYYSTKTFIENPQTPYNTSGYGVVTFPITLHREYGGSNVIRSIYENYSNYDTSNSFDELKTIITDGIKDSGYNQDFNIAYRKMEGFLNNTQVWLGNLLGSAGYYNNGEERIWPNRSKTHIALTPGQTTTVTGSLSNYLTSNYYQIDTPENTVTAIEISIQFNTNNCYAELYRTQLQGYNVGYPSTNSQCAYFADSCIGRFVTESGFIITNLDSSITSTYIITLNLMYQDQAFTFSALNTDRYVERRIYLNDNQYAEYTVTFGTSGNKIIQTFGSSDTVMEIRTMDGTVIASSDDEGYNYNSLISIDTYANQTLKIRIRLYGEDYKDGWTKLSITPAFYCLENGSTSYNEFEDVLNINSWPNFDWYAYASINYLQTITFSAPTEGTYTIKLNSVFDNYLYVIDPTSSDKLIDGIDFNDDCDEDDFNASITRTLSTSKKYYILYGQYNISRAFTNYDEGDDILVSFRLN